MEEHRSTDERVELIQVTIPAASASLLASACSDGMDQLPAGSPQFNVLRDLRDFFEEASVNPRGFVPTGRMATSLKMRARRVDGVRRNDGSLQDGTPRAHRTARRKAAHKKRRAERAETAASFNDARRIIEREMEGDRPLSVLERIRGLAGGSPGRPEGEDTAPDVQGQ